MLIVVTGLEPRIDVDDVDIFLEICEKYITTKPVVSKHRCRRLGKPVAYKVQPLLIVLDREERQLRNYCMVLLICDLLKMLIS